MLTCSSTSLDHYIPVLGVGIQRANGGMGASGGYIWKMKMAYCKLLLKTQDALLNTADNRT